MTHPAGELTAETSQLPEASSVIDSIFGLQELDTDLYMALKSWKTRKARGTFGGLIIGHALFAACNTVPPGLLLHSMHSYFLRAGDPHIATIYRVQRTRDGQSYSSRTVSAIQKGRPILTLQASFHREDAELANSLQYQPVMPAVKHHQHLPTVAEYADKLISDENVHTKLKSVLKRSLKEDFTVEMKPVDPEMYLRFKPNPDHTLLTWVKVSAMLGDDQNKHRCVAAFVSDFNLIYSSTPSSARVAMSASLDHSVWFHQSFKMDRWLLYEATGIQLHNTRVFCHGRFWTEDGQLVASHAQEGIIRSKL